MNDLTFLWSLVKKVYNLRDDAFPDHRVLEGEAIPKYLAGGERMKPVTARTLRHVPCNAPAYYKILLNKTTSITVDVLIHELAHIVAWERPDLLAEGHNMAFMDIYYILCEEVDKRRDKYEAGIKSVLAV